MRTREEIEKEVKSFFPESGQRAYNTAAIPAILEVVLDIRDLLEKLIIK